MAFKKPKQQPEFADLKGILAQSKDTDNALYQTVQILIERLTQFQLVTLKEVADLTNSVNNSITVINIKADKTPTFLTATDESAKLPNSRNTKAGLGIIFDDSVPNERTISAASNLIGGGYVPMCNGNYPAEVMYVGRSVLMIAYSGD